jgi:hypothetical protein
MTFESRISIELFIVIPLLVMHISLAWLAYKDWLQRERMRIFTRQAWFLLIVLGGILGPLSYFMFGREV